MSCDEDVNKLIFIYIYIYIYIYMIGVCSKQRHIQFQYILLDSIEKIN